MKRTIILLCLLFVLVGCIQADKINANHKSAKKAMLLSSIFPGSGEFYVSKKSITAYIFPVLEVGFWTGYLYYNQKGDDEENKYKKYADEYYDRDKQFHTQRLLIDVHEGTDDVYDDGHQDEWGNGGLFRLDKQNTQHFYEDIAKYDKYVFGWQDWYAHNVLENNDGSISSNWVWETNISQGDTTYVVGWECSICSI